MSSIFDIDIVRRKDALVLVVSGEIDLATAPELELALTRAEASDAPQLWIDIERVMFMDATGLGVLVRHATLDENVERLRITPGPPQVQRLFELSGLRSYLPLHTLS